MSNTITDGLCRCCHTEGDFKNLGIPYNNNGIDEVFCDMLLATFCLDVTTMEGEVDSTLYGICDVCQLRLRDATSFKQQVLKCEQKFQQLKTLKDEKMPVVDIEDQPSMLRSNQGKTKVSDNDANWTAAGDHSDDETTKPMKSKTKKFSCDVCQKSFSNNGSLEVHMRIHTGEKTYQCQLCNNKFVHNKALIKHIENNHSDGDRKVKEARFLKTDIKLGRCEKEQLKFKCSHCEKEFQLKQVLNQHLKTHTGEKKHICEVCNKPFGRNYTLKCHMRVHTGIKPYSCSFCSRQFADKSSFKRHERKHTGERPFSCKVCKKQFSDNRYMKIHMRVHTGERPFSCNVCDTKFTYSTSLNNHNKRFHSDERPFKCNKCNKQFTFRSEFKLHMRMHTGEKPFSCDVCNIKFTRSNSLRKHTLTKKHCISGEGSKYGEGKPDPMKFNR